MRLFLVADSGPLFRLGNFQIEGLVAHEGQGGALRVRKQHHGLATEQRARRGLTLVPERLFWKGPWVKLDLCLCSGKDKDDKRRDLIARAYAQMRAAEALLRLGFEKFEDGLPCGEEANMGKMLSADASWAAGEACIQTHGGFGFAEEYDVERKYREARLYQVAPISTNLILSFVAEHVLGLPRSF